MFNPYENIIIGNFLFGLGLAMGRRPQPIVGCVNLLQQTPLDQVLGDVMLQFPAAWRLIEFKRVGARIEKEQAKQQMFLASTHHRPDLHVASRSVHWFAISGEEERQEAGWVPGEFPMRVRPYLDFESTCGISLDAFVDRLVDQAHGAPPLSERQLAEYMQITLAFGGIRSLNGAGLLVAYEGGGGIRYLPVPNVADLQGTGRMLTERMEEMSRDVSRYLERAEPPRQFGQEAGKGKQATTQQGLTR